jgi:chromosome segregation ATPase
MDALQAELARRSHALEVRGLETEAQARRADDLQQRHDRLANELATETGRARDAEQRQDRLASRLAAEAGRVRDAEQRNVQLAAQVQALEDTGQATQRHNEALTAKMLELDQELRHERHRQLVHARSLRWLLGSVRAELRRRWRGGADG